MITKHETEVVFAQGKERGLHGASPAENPYQPTTNGQRNLLHAAWSKGHAAGLRIREENA